VLDNLMLRLIEIEEGIEKADHASDVKFKGAGGVKSAHHKPSPLATQKNPRRSPPPPQSAESSSEDEDDEDEDAEDDEEEDLGLVRFPSGSAQPPQPPSLNPSAQPPPLDPSDDDGSSSEEDLDDLLQPVFEDPDPELLKKVTAEKGNDEMTKILNDVRSCPCHGQKNDVPPIKNFWELPIVGNGEMGGIRTALVEVAAYE
jgi:hypothetical protein